MKLSKSIVFLILMVSLLPGCGFIVSPWKYKAKTQELMETLLREDYDNAIQLFALEHDIAKNGGIHVLRNGLEVFRAKTVNHYGTNLTYSFIRWEKRFSTYEMTNTPPNTTMVFVEITNNQKIGILNVLFDDVSGKILNIDVINIDQPIPSMVPFWMFGVLAFCIVLFNIYVIRLIKRSDLEKKWLKYLAVILINAPTISYTVMHGLSFNLLSFQFLMGVSFGYMGYLNSYWAFGIPLGGIYWFWKLKVKKVALSQPNAAPIPSYELKDVQDK